HPHFIFLLSQQGHKTKAQSQSDKNESHNHLLKRINLGTKQSGLAYHVKQLFCVWVFMDSYGRALGIWKCWLFL
ncbi:MAG TPA: hypothetical protein PLX59_06795, partial [Candidatus Cloacimonadota bacterium]|nr:hypothetical protein [Candidatus Cloacimonadota bacterium]